MVDATSFDGTSKRAGGRYELHYHEAGNGPVLVLLHGSGPGVSGWSNFHSLFDHAGGGALRRATPLQRFWRDAHAGLHHIINVREKTLHSYASVAMGGSPLEAML